MIDLLWDGHYCPAKELANVPNTLRSIESDLVQCFTSNEDQEKDNQNGKIKQLMEVQEPIEDWLDEAHFLLILINVFASCHFFILLITTKVPLCPIFELILCETQTYLIFINILHFKDVRGR